MDEVLARGPWNEIDDDPRNWIALHRFKNKVWFYDKTFFMALPQYANNAAAIAGGLTIGALYRTGADPDLVCVVH